MENKNKMNWKGILLNILLWILKFISYMCATVKKAADAGINKIKNR
jgi:hypothetical protein